VAILGEEKVEAIEVVRNELVDGRAVATDEHETIPCGIVFRSVGYRGTPIEGIPFDEGSCTVPNDGGRVLDADGAPLPGVYCAGWIKRGPSGVIGTNKKDATETVERLIADAGAGVLEHGGDAAAVDALLASRGVAVVTQDGWEAIDRTERAAGEPHGRPRIKLAEWDALLDAAGLEPVAR
jgi:ferredoxin--NADP+ reductase